MLSKRMVKHKEACKRLGITYSISSCKAFIHNAYMLDLFACSGLTQTRKLLTNFSKNSFFLLLEPLSFG